MHSSGLSHSWSKPFLSFDTYVLQFILLIISSDGSSSAGSVVLYCCSSSLESSVQKTPLCIETEAAELEPSADVVSSELVKLFCWTRTKNK